MPRRPHLPHPHMPHLHMPHLPERWTLGKMQNPVRGFLHGTAALASVAAGIVLLVRSSGGFWAKFAFAVFGLAMIALYTVSTLYHTIPWRQVWKQRMQRVDHSAIFVFIAATYTPIAAIVFDGWIRWLTLAVVWSIALTGVLLLAFRSNTAKGLSVVLNATLGWLAVFLLAPMVDRLPWTAVMWMFIGGGLYTVGMVFLITNRPRLWPRVFSYHEAFHVLVIGGTIAHYLVHFRYVARFAG